MKCAWTSCFTIRILKNSSSVKIGFMNRRLSSSKSTCKYVSILSFPTLIIYIQYCIYLYIHILFAKCNASLHKLTFKLMIIIIIIILIMIIITIIIILIVLLMIMIMIIMITIIKIRNVKCHF